MSRLKKTLINFSKGEKLGDQKWNGIGAKENSMDKRKAVDDSQTGVGISRNYFFSTKKLNNISVQQSPSPRLISLRGSDFTGLGIEICGGLKDGIFVKKVMPQGPAANIVRIGDKITSITIDLRHMVQEDAATILSYASPYNVQLALIDGNGVLTYAPPANSPKSAAAGQRSLTHPLYRSSSQEDFNTIERNARRKYPSGSTDEGNYPTLKMEQKTNNLPVVHRENEKKTTAKTVDETKQNRASSNSITKFGVRVLPPTVAIVNEKSPTKGQAENENNTNKEVEVDVVATKRLSPPPISKRTKHMKVDDAKPADVVSQLNEESEFERQRSINSSGIRRDAAGIPQEIPNQMMAAAMAARDHRKSNVADTNDSKRNKGMAPSRPLIGDLNDSIDTEVTNISLNSVDSVDSSKRHNFTDNFEPSEDQLHTPPSGRKVQHGSDTESQLAAYDQGEFTYSIYLCSYFISHK